MANSTLKNAYVIGQQNFEKWKSDYDPSGYLKVLPHPDQEITFNDPYRDWQLGKAGNYISSWGEQKELKATLTMSDLEEIEIEGFGTLKAGDGIIPWLDNEATPYEYLRAYNGTIPGLMIITEPGDTLNLTLVNDLTKNKDSSEQPKDNSNFHGHGLHVSPVGKGDNVLVEVKPGESQNINIAIPDNQTIGTDWYHPHLHGQTTVQLGSGLAGQLIVAAPHDLADIDKANPKEVPAHYFAINSFGIQQQLREGKAGDPLNQSSTEVPAGTPIDNLGTEADGDPVYQLSDAPFMGYNGKTATGLYDPTQPTGDSSKQPPLFPYGGGPQEEPVENVIHTVNGQYNPTLKIPTGEWHTFSFTNMNPNAFHVLQVVKEDSQGNLTPQTTSLIGIDGDVSGTSADKRREIKELPVLNPGGRLTIQEWFETPGTYYVLSNATEEILGDDAPVLTKDKGFQDGHLNWGSQVLATIKVEGDAKPTGAIPEPLSISQAQSQKNDDFVKSVKDGDFTQERTFTWSASFADKADPTVPPSDAEPITFEGVYRINGKYFSLESMTPLAMPMLGTQEKWTIVNESGIGPFGAALTEWHPFHIHQNEFSVLSINGIPVDELSSQYKLDGRLSDTIGLSPTYKTGTATKDNPYGEILPEYSGPNQKNDVSPSEVELAMKFEDYPGTFVNHCHILFHEDAGMMAPVRIILNTEKTWLGLDAEENTNGQVTLVQASDSKKSISLNPYGLKFQEAIDVAIADVNYKNTVNNDTSNVTDNVTDVVTLQRSLEKASDKFTVKVFDGKILFDQQQAGKNTVDPLDTTSIIREINPFQNIAASTQQITSLAVGDINGDGFSDIVAGISGGIVPKIEIYSGKDGTLMSRLNPFHHETFTGKINLAVGDANGDNYDDVIVAQGSGGKGLVEIYDGQKISTHGSLDNGNDTAHKSALLFDDDDEKSIFQPYGDSYNGEVDVTSGYILQRPEQPVEEGKNQYVQTYRANITTVAKGTVPTGMKQVRVHTYLGAGAHEHGSTPSSETTSAQTATATSQATLAATEDHAAHTTDSSTATKKSFSRVDAEFNLDGNQQIKDVLGTFADIPDAPKGEPVLLVRTVEDTHQFIHLIDGNDPDFNPVSETPATITQNSDQKTFKIANNGLDAPKIKVSLKGRSSKLVNELGVFFTDDASGKIDGLAPGSAGYTEAALSRSQTILSAIANNPNGFNSDNLTRIIELNGANLRFYLVKNSTSDNVRKGITATTEVIFGDTSSQKTTDLGNNSFSLAWKDGNNSVNDFQDLVVNIQSTTDSFTLGTRMQGKPQGENLDLRDITGQVKADFIVNREAAFNNFVGFYQVADPLIGGIDTNGDGKADVLPGDAGYAQAAVRGRVQGIDLAVNNQGTATATGTFQSGAIFAPFIIVDGSPDAVLNSAANQAPEVYFTYLGANSDNRDHIRMLGNNIFGFEDLHMGGDGDFNDMIARVNLTKV
ncbi:MAG: DUF4114 domain-containing protein [Crinalium sp.]